MIPAPSIPDHEMIRPIGRGAYGEVWLARSVTGAFRAVKVVYRSSFDRERPFEREFEGIRQFEPVSRLHDSQVDILHIGRGEDHFYYVMELADDQFSGGQILPDQYAPRTLKSDLVFKSRLDFEQSVAIGIALTTALQHLHENGLVHRDVKPSNIIFVNGQPKLADIGLVTALDSTRSYVGTEGFAAPEGTGTPQADIYSLGKVLYEISTGRDRQEFPDLPTEIRELPDREGLIELNSVIARACRQDPKDRYASAAQMRADLELLQSGKSLARLHRTQKQLRFVQRAGALVTAVAALIALGWLWQAGQTKALRQLAAENATLAEEKTRLAKESQNRLIQSQNANGLRAMQDGDLSTAGLWFADVLALSQNNDELERRQRDRLGFLFSQSPRPVALLTLSTSGQSLRMTSDGEYLIGTGFSTIGGEQCAEIKTWNNRSFTHVRSVFFTNTLERVVISPKGKWAIVPERDGLWVVDVASGLRTSNKPLPEGDIAAWSSDELLIATVRSDATNVYVLEVPSGRQVSPALPHADVVARVAFDPTGRWLITGTRIARNPPEWPSGQFRIWSTSTWHPVSDPIEVEGIAVGVEVSPDGKSALVFGDRNYGQSGTIVSTRAKMLALPSGRARFSALEHQDKIVTAGFSPDGRFVATGTANQFVAVWNASTGIQVGPALKHGNEGAYKLRFSPDGGWLAAGGRADLQIWNFTSGRPDEINIQLSEEVVDFKFTPDSRHMLVLARSGRLRVYDFASLQPRIPMLRPAFPFPASGVFSPDGSRLVINSSDGDLQLWDALLGLPLAGPSQVSSTNRIGLHRNVPNWSPDGSSILVASGDSTARLWSCDLQQERFSPLCHSNLVTSTAFSPDGKKIATASWDGTVRIWDAQSGHLIDKTLHHDAEVFCCTFSPDGHFLVTTCGDGTVSIWTVATGTRRVIMSQSERLVRLAAFSPQGNRIAVCDQQGLTTLHNIPDGLQVGTVMRHAGAVLQILFSPNGRHILTTSMDRTARVWDAENGDAITPPLSHSGYVVTGCFSPDGSRVITASHDSTAQVWDALTGEPMGPRLKHQNAVSWAAFSPDDRKVVTVGFEGSAQIWELPLLDWSPREVVAMARLLAGAQIGASGEITPMSPVELDREWNWVKQHVQPSTSEWKRDSILWHRGRLIESEFNQNITTAEFHSRWLVSLQPESDACRAELSRIQSLIISPRDEATPTGCIDLTGCYNVSFPMGWHDIASKNLQEFPRGLQILDGTPFDARGLIQVVGESYKPVPVRYPREVRGIQIQKKLKTLHFLQGIIRGPPTEGSRIGHYAVHYADGLREQIPIVYGLDAQDWWEKPEDPLTCTRAVVAWRGSNQATREAGCSLRVFKRTWENPRPDVEVTTLDFVAEHPSTCPFLIALTAE